LIRIVTLILLIFSSAQGISNESAREYFKFAKFSFDAREYDQAIEFINKAIEIDPHYSSGLLLRANINLKLEHFNAILPDVNEVINAEGQATSIYGQAYTLRGAAFLFTEELAKAKDDLLESLNFDPDNELTYFYLGLWAHQTGSYFQALEYFDHAIKLSPSNFEYYYQRAQTKIDNYNPIPGTPTFDNIMADIDQAINLNPEDFRAYKLRCDMLKLEAQGSKEYYIEELTKTIEMFPNQAAFYAQRGMARILEYKFAEALLDLDKAITYMGADSDVLRNRALCHHNLNNYQAALEDYTTSIEILIEKFQENQSRASKKVLAETLVMRGRTYQQLSNPNDACSDFYNAAKLGSRTGLNNYRRSCNVFN